MPKSTDKINAERGMKTTNNREEVRRETPMRTPARRQPVSKETNSGKR